MVRNYWKIALRNLQKQKVITAINCTGLSVGIACFTLLLLFAANEYGFDRFHRHSRDIYRLYTFWDRSLMNGREPEPNLDYDNPTGQKIGPALKQYFPDVVDYVNLQTAWGENLVRVGDKTIRAEWSYAEPSLFTVFDFPLVAGTNTSVLQDRKSVV